MFIDHNFGTFLLAREGLVDDDFLSWLPRAGLSPVTMLGIELSNKFVYL